MGWFGASKDRPASISTALNRPRTHGTPHTYTRKARLINLVTPICVGRERIEPTHNQNKRRDPEVTRSAERVPCQPLSIGTRPCEIFTPETPERNSKKEDSAPNAKKRCPRRSHFFPLPPNPRGRAAAPPVGGGGANWCFSFFCCAPWCLGCSAASPARPPLVSS